MLQKHEADLEQDDRSRWRPFTRVFANILGNGRWFDTYVPNLVVPVGTPGWPCRTTRPAPPGASGGAR